MNKILREEIVKHIMSNFLIISSDFINVDKSKSLMSDDLLLDSKLNFENNNKNIWGCQLLLDKQEFKIIVGDCTQDKKYPEFCIVAQLSGTPAYGLYFVYDESDSEALIALSLDGKAWMECNTYFQASFLAGMEQIRDVAVPWEKCKNYKEQYEMMISFIKYHTSMYEEKDEG